MNTITPKEKSKKNFVKVSTLDDGTLVQWYDPCTKLNEIFIVSAYKESTIAALSLSNGTYLSADALVEVVPKGEEFTITAGGK
jgi:hypothetical protein